MIILEGLVQGSDKWLEVRGKYRTASEASMVMNCHPNVSRAELLRMKATGTTQEFSEWVERNILDKGHQVEALARPIIEDQIGDDLYPIVAVDDSKTYLASFDGITMTEDTTWECKQFNKAKADSVNSQQVPECDYWQVLHQLMVSGADKAIYTVSDGTPEGTISVEMLPSKADIEALQAAWNQFEADLAVYEHKPVTEKPKGKAQIDLPALVVEITGQVKDSNLPAFQSQALAMIQSINTELVTDEDFANAEQTVKALDAGEKELESVKARALAQTASIDELFKTIDSLKGEMRDKRLLLNKLVKSEKEARRFEQIKRGQDALTAHINSVNDTFTGKIKVPMMQGDFAGVVKGKKALQSVHDAIDSEIARCKIEVNQQADLLRKNVELLNTLGADYKFLFSDAADIVLKASEDLESLIKARITDHQAAEQAKLEAERVRIQQEEERKAKAKAEAEHRQIEADRKATEQVKQTPIPDLVASKIPLSQSIEQQMDFAEEMITITSTEYNQLLRDSDMLDALMAAGVDSWSGYDDAMEVLENAA